MRKKKGILPVELLTLTPITGSFTPLPLVSLFHSFALFCLTVSLLSLSVEQFHSSPFGRAVSLLRFILSHSFTRSPRNLGLTSFAPLPLSRAVSLLNLFPYSLTG